ncbi:stress-response A/B barrel domain-containing protein UP3 [Macadamia integrifolia]|uniref:stress-response A/B barrel domain-containing protein UP3 n=1 Tax=Macadamia integrifolia TaxID=60698 RepID=UPI001C4E9D1D|nr:stress-response A/B barrel domain-containing protein UP3 [Macadamia integrifolia]
MMCQCLRTRTKSLFPTSSKFNLSTSRAFPLQRKPSSHFKPFCSSSSTSPAKMSAQTIEHIVLFKVKDETEPSKINFMISGLNALNSLNQVLHLTAGSIHRNRSSAFAFTHLLHSRYRTKEDLNGYAVHPEHVKVVKESVLPICDDIMAVDWVADLDGSVAPQPGAAMRLTFLKLKEGSGDNEKEQVLGVIGSIKDSFPSIDQISLGENFSPARAKGFSIASLAVFPGLNELDALDSNEELVKAQKDKARDLLESVIVIDYAIPPSQTANL